MLEYVEGNLLESPVEALVNTVNEIGVMGKGIALMFKEAFPENNRKYVEACKKKEVQVGKVFITHNAALMGPKWIVNFPTKKHWRNPSQLAWIRDGLADLRKVIQEEKITSIAIPPLGCGNGGLDWNDVRPEIEKALRDIPGLEVRVFSPTSRYLTPAKAEGLQSLTAARAMIAEMTRRYSILGMDCSLLELQKIAWFLQRTLVRLGIDNPLKLQFSAESYGPYSDSLRHLLNGLDGSYLHCGKRLADAGPFDSISFNEARRNEVSEYLHEESNRPYLNALDSSTRIIEGFESPLSMELLATVDWLLHAGGAEPNLRSIREGLANWPGGAEAGRRKLRLFSDRMLELALARLARDSATLHILTNPVNCR